MILHFLTLVITLTSCYCSTYDWTLVTHNKNTKKNHYRDKLQKAVFDEVLFLKELTLRGCGSSGYSQKICSGETSAKTTFLLRDLRTKKRWRHSEGTAKRAPAKRLPQRMMWEHDVGVFYRLRISPHQTRAFPVPLPLDLMRSFSCNDVVARLRKSRMLRAPRARDWPVPVR